MVELIAEDQVAFFDKRRDNANVGRVSSGEYDRGFLGEEVSKPRFEFAVRGGATGDETRCRRAHTIRFQARGRSCLEASIIREPKVVV